MIFIDTRAEIKRGMTISIPLLLGYVPPALSFGILAKAAGLSLSDTFLMSFFVYAGASQFMAIDLIVQGISYGSIILTTFLINLRHIMMSASLSVDLKDIDRKFIPLIAYGITDETFAITSFNRDKISTPFILTLFLLAHTTWWVTCVLGYLVGEILPQSLQSSLSIGLYAMFTALLFSQLKKDRSIALLAIISMLIYFIIFKIRIIGSGWDIILAILLSSGLGTYIFGNRGER